MLGDVPVEAGDAGFAAAPEVSAFAGIPLYPPLLPPRMSPVDGSLWVDEDDMK